MAMSNKQRAFKHDAKHIDEALGFTSEEVQEALDFVNTLANTGGIKRSELIEKIIENINPVLITYFMFSVLDTQQVLLEHPFLGELNKKAIADQKK